MKELQSLCDPIISKVYRGFSSTPGDSKTSEEETNDEF